MLDAPITQGSYWGGSQLSYTTYMILAILPFTGLFGIDHLALRSPLTAFLKMLSIIPLFGFWYFYDIAQVCGEDELVKKYGIGVPFYGPVGIGKGIFTGSPNVNQSSKEMPRPWLFMAYAITTMLFICFPLNKFVIGDYEAGIVYVILFICIIGIPLVIAQGLYDVFNLLFNTRSIFEEGIARIPGIATLFKNKFNYTLMGPKPGCDQNGTPPGGCDPSLANVLVKEGIKTSVEVATTGVRAELSVAKGATATAKAAAEIAEEISQNPKQAAAALGLLPQLPPGSPSTAVPTTAVTNPLAAASFLGAPKLKQGGGALQLLDLAAITPSIPILLFSVGLLAFSGYVFYIYKNTYRKPEKSDDPPREPRAVRVPSERSQ